MALSPRRVNSFQLSVIAIVLAGAPLTGWSITCEVPTDKATIRLALIDPNCTEIQLLPQVYPESVTVTRNVNIFGHFEGTSVIRGSVEVRGPEVSSILMDFEIQDGCTLPGLSSTNGAEISNFNVEVNSSNQIPCGVPSESIFSNGFE